MRAGLPPGTAGVLERPWHPWAPFVSVIVPVFNDAVRLRTCLEALAEQTFPGDRFEVVVVDNGSDQPLDALVADFPLARLTVEPRPGAYAARNKGIALSRGDILAFTDSDCLPAPTWLECGVRSLTEHQNCGLVGGHIEVVFSNPGRPAAVELFSALNARRQHVFIERDHFAETANLFTTRAVLAKVGPFDPCLKARGDVLWGQRVFRAGYSLRYCPEAVVRHPSVRSLRQLYRRTVRMVGGKHDVARRPETAGLAATATGSTDLAQLFPLVWRILGDRRLRPWDQARLLALLVLVQSWALAERIRLRLGGTSRR